MSDPNSYTRPVLGPRVQKQVEEGAFREQTLAPIYPEPPDGSEIAGVNTPPVLPYLTPDAMLVYCQSRLTGINTQCRDIMTRQEKNAKDQAAIGDLVSTLTTYQDGVKGDWPKIQKIKDAYAKAIDDVGGPQSTIGKELVHDLETLLGDADKNGIGSLITAAKSHQSELNSSSEIDMIRLQSLMSQRQTAIQLTTNIVQSLNDQTNKIVANIGH
jgi:hypothetical protein